MRPRRSEPLGRAAARVALVLSLLAPGLAVAQSGGRSEGAQELALPVGAGIIAMGQAGVAEQAGTESAWSNPAGLAWLRRPEAALHHGQTAIYTSDVLALVAPRAPVGVFGLAVHLVNYGEAGVTGSTEDPLGSATLRAIVANGSFATTFGRRLSAGVNFKLYQFRSDCTGICEGFPSGTSNTSAIDAGMQYRVGPAAAPLWLGVAARNVGLSFQVRDEQQSDVIQTRYDVGAAYAPSLAALAPGLSARVAVQLVRSPHLPGLGTRFGTAILWQDVASVRLGYSKGEAHGPSGPSLGVGVRRGRVRIDLARLLGTEQQIGGEAPTYLSLGLGF
jgi:hypothetical protein